MSVLDNPCLVLNSQWKPIRVIPVRNAIELCTRDRAYLLDTKDYQRLDWAAWLDYYNENYQFIPTVTRGIPAPEIAILKAYGGMPPKKLAVSREGVLRRDIYICQYCWQAFSSKELTLDHVNPKSRGGRKSWENLVSACRRCNETKRDRTPEEAGMKLKNTPTIPKWAPRLKLPETYPDSWEDFLKSE